MSQPESGHLLNPTGRFSDRAADYAKHRPTYPAAAVDAVIDGLDDPRSLLAADVGAGTGIFSRLLAARGVRVLAIEPNASMRDAAERHSLVEFRAASAEATELADSSVDLVTCAQAFHWFEPRAALAEFARILKPGGRLALIWNDRDPADPATRAYGESFDRVADVPPSLRNAQSETHLAASPLFTDYRLEEFRFTQPHDEAGLIGRALSASYAPKAGPRHDELISILRSIARTYADARGVITLHYITTIYLAEKRQ